MEVEAYYMLILIRKTVILTFTLILKLQEAFKIKIPTHVVVSKFLLNICILILY